MGSMAIALGIKLEKKGYYVLGENIILTSEYGSFHRQTGTKWVGYQIASCNPVYAKWIQAHVDSTSNL